MEGKEALLLGLRRNIGNGQHTNIDDPWIPDVDESRSGVTNDTNIRVSELILQPRGIWDREKLQRIFPWETVKQILSIPIGPANLNDRWIWYHNPKGKYTVRSGYRVLSEQQRRNQTTTETGQRKLWRWIWSLKLPPKLKFFIWRIARNVLTTKTNLRKRCCANDAECCYCGSEEESAEHIFFHCPAKEEFRAKFNHLGRPEEREGATRQWLINLIDKVNEDSMIDLAHGLWTLWKTRNAKVFDNTDLSIQDMDTRWSTDCRRWRNCIQNIVFGDLDFP
ncbi:hypothetical protein LINPERHAP2_LOCUS36593 [Linum perenne]